MTTQSLVRAREGVNVQITGTAAKFRPHQTGLEIEGEATYEEWYAAAETVIGLHRASPWMIGDILNYGEERFGERYSQIIDPVSRQYAVQTLKNYASVASRMPPERRRADLTFSHHSEVVNLDPPVADALLDAAAREGISVASLREAAATYRGALGSGRTVNGTAGDSAPEWERLGFSTAGVYRHYLIQKADMERIVPGIIVTPTSLTFPDSMTWEQYRRFGDWINVALLLPGIPERTEEQQRADYERWLQLTGRTEPVRADHAA